MQLIQTIRKCSESVRSTRAALDLTGEQYIVSALSARYLQAVEMSGRAREYFENIGAGVSSTLRTKWEQDITDAESKRLHNPAAMDILGASSKPSADSHAPSPSSEHSEVEEWIQMAIDHEKMQYAAILLCRSGN